MPSLTHEGFVELFRNRPELARELLALCRGVDLPAGVLEAASIDLSQVTPTDYRCDAVALIKNADGAIVGGVIVEVQLSRDDVKRWTWPVYVTALRARHRCPAYLLVLAPDESVARWAAEPIEIAPSTRMMPIVIDLAMIPRVEVTASPELAVLAAIAHADARAALVAGHAIRLLDEDTRKLYFDLFWVALPEGVQQTLMEADVALENAEYVDEIDGKIFPGLRRLVSKAREEGREEGRLLSVRQLVMQLATTKLGTIDADTQAAIEAASDVSTLSELVLALGIAGDAPTARAALDRLLRPGRT